MRILSDIHGNWRYAYAACKDYNDTVYQIGDLGIFTRADMSLIPKNLKFFAGNHDNYKLMEGHKGYLGRFGYINEDTFFVSGAYSIDKAFRVPGVSWWDYEELSWSECNEACEIYKGCKLLLSHDCSATAAKHMFGITENSVTRILLNELINIGKPELHIFGHHHVKLEHKIDGVTNRCIAENCWIDI